jgi:hypothetical protein
VATAARAGLGEKSHSPATHTMEMRAKETELEVLVAAVLDPKTCHLTVGTVVGRISTVVPQGTKRCL